MKVMDTLKKFAYIQMYHPLSLTINVMVLIGIFLRMYCRWTVGLYKGDQDMTGKTVLITGASDGIGKATALDLAKRNARVLMACRNPNKTLKVAQEIKLASGNSNVAVFSLDLCSFESVRKCAQDVLKHEDKLHVLINNAGMPGMSRSLTDDRCETVMQVNHFGHFLLTMLLLDLLKKSSPSRIINVSSLAHYFAKLDLNDLTNLEDITGFLVYSNTKLINILFTRELAKRLEGTGVIVNALHPGCVKTEIVNKKRDILSFIFRLHFHIVGKTQEEGAQTTIRLAVDPSLEKTTGKYFSDCKVARVSKTAKNSVLARKIFDISEQIVGVTFDESTTL